jgi:cysteine-rich repeat protein
MCSRVLPLFVVLGLISGDGAVQGCPQAGGCNQTRKMPTPHRRLNKSLGGRESRRDLRPSMGGDPRPSEAQASLGPATAGWSLKPLSIAPTVVDAPSILPARASPRQQLNARSTEAKYERAVLAAASRHLLDLEEAVPADRADDSGICMSLPANQSMPVAAVASAPEGDPCRFAGGEERWGSACQDPYFGGSLRCCFSPDSNGTCSLCSTATSCTSAKAVQCAQRCADCSSIVCCSRAARLHSAPPAGTAPQTDSSDARIRFASSYLTGNPAHDLLNLDSLSETYSIRRSSCVKAGPTMAGEGNVFLEILAPGLADDFPSDIKPELSSTMSGVLDALSATVEGLSIGKVTAGSMQLLIRSTSENWVWAHESPVTLRLVADAYTVAMSQLELAGNFGNWPELQAAFAGASSAFARKLSGQDRAFWHHTGLLTYGRVAIKTVISSTREASTCAALCSSDSECSTFAFSFLERLCFLMKDAQLHLCDPDTSSSCREKSSLLLDQVSRSARCRYCVFYQEDSTLLYCASNSDRCSTLREYNECLHRGGCGNSKTDKDFQVPSVRHNFTCVSHELCPLLFRSRPAANLTGTNCGQMHSDMCHTHGCTAAQCGLEASACNTTAYACAREYLECSSTQIDRCSCATPYVKCMSDGGCVEKESGIPRVTIHEMCLLDGCSSDQCHLVSQELEHKASDEPGSRAEKVHEAYIKNLEETLAFQAFNATHFANADFERLCNDTWCNSACGTMCQRTGSQNQSSLSQCLYGCFAVLGRRMVESTASKPCETSTLRCSHEYADCFTRTTSNYNWTSTLIRSSYTGFGIPFQIQGHTLLLPGMDGSAAARTQSPIPKGKIYWEYTISGTCAYVGIATQRYSISSVPGRGAESWAIGDFGFGAELMHNVTLDLGIRLSQGSVLGFALESSTGSLWVSVDGEWLSNGNPVTRRRPLTTLQGSFTDLYPVVGVPSGCGSQVRVTIHPTSESLTYRPPNGFVPPAAETCSCSSHFSDCLNSNGCLSSEEKTKLYDTCLASGCQRQECGKDTVISTAECSRAAELKCSRQNLVCMATLGPGASPMDTCSCTKNMMQCLKRNNCQLDTVNVRKVSSECVANGCSAADCGLCSVNCNSTVLACSENYLQCKWQTQSREHQCACASAFYQCSKEGMCDDEDTAKVHSEMCVANDCSASECGLPDHLSVCNRSALKCADSYFECTSTVMHKHDPCAANFKSERRYAEEGEGYSMRRMCSDPTVGGIENCRYNPSQETCTSAEHCQCSQQFVECVGLHCLDAPAVQQLASNCLEDGCTAQECGFSQGSCNQTGLICASQYLECEGAQAHAKSMSIEPSFRFGCGVPVCERNLFVCMHQRSCLSLEKIVLQGEQCLRSNCTAQECGLEGSSVEVLMLPDAPGNIQLRSLTDAKMSVRWSNSRLANYWAAVGSRNRIKSFRIILDSHCKLIISVRGGFEAQCANSTVAWREVSGSTFEVVFFGLQIGMIYQVSVVAYNMEGSGPPSRSQITLAGPPDPVSAFTAVLFGPMAVRFRWFAPANSPALQNSPILGYTLSLSPDPSRQSITVSLSPETRQLDINSFVQGSFGFCATEGQKCPCRGAVRFGPEAGSLWSPLLMSDGYGILCEPSSGFRMDVDTGGKGQCQCNPQAIPLIRGLNLTVTITAFNTIGRSDAATVHIKIMGLASDVRDLSACDCQTCTSACTDSQGLAVDGLKVSWLPPSDTGFGTSDNSAVIRSYYITYSTCSNFGSASSCRTRLVSMDAQGCVMCQIMIHPSLLEEQTIYHVRVQARNDVGHSFFRGSPSTSSVWQAFPSVIFPRAEDFPLRVTEWNAKHYFSIDPDSLGVFIVIENLPKREIGEVLPIMVHSGADTFPGSMTVKAREPVTEGVNMMLSQGLQTRTTLSLQLPIMNKTSGSASVSLPLSYNYQIVNVAFKLSYFALKPAAVDFMAPSFGPMTGGTTVRVDISEPDGPESRAHFHIPSFFDAVSRPASLSIAFGDTGAANLITIRKISQGQVQIDMLTPSRAGFSAGAVGVGFKFNGLPLSILPSYFLYGRGFITSILPATGLTIGGTQVSIFLQINDYSVIRADVTMGGIPVSTTKKIESVGSDRWKLTVISPSLPVGHVIVSVLVNADAGENALTLTSDKLYEVALPPEPLINEISITLDGIAQHDLWVDRETSASLYVTVLYLGFPQAVQVSFGDCPGNNDCLGTDVVFTNTGPANDVRQTVTSITVSTPVSLSARRVHFKVIATYPGGLVKQTVSVTMIEFKNLRTPTVLATYPSKGRQYGGSIVFLGLISSCAAQECPPRSLQVSFTEVGGVAKNQRVMAAFTLVTWEQSGFQTIQDPAFSEWYRTNRLSGELSLLSAAVPEYLRGKLNNDYITSSNSFILVIETSSWSSNAAVTGKVSNNGTPLASFAFEYLPQIVGEASIVSIIPNRVPKDEEVLVTVTLENFQHLVFASEVVLVIDDQGYAIESLNSNGIRTSICFWITASSRGTKTVVLTAMSRSVTFLLDVFSADDPVVLSFRPEEHYENGKSHVTVFIKQFASTFITLEFVNIEIQQFLTPVKHVLQSDMAMSVSPDATGSIVVQLTFTLPAGIAGPASVFVYNVVEAKFVSFDISYIQAPIGPAGLRLDPESGSLIGGFVVTFVLTNFRRADGAEELDVSIDGMSTAILGKTLRSTSTITSFDVMMPSASRARTVMIRVSHAKASALATAASVAFTFIDPQVPIFKYALPLFADSAQISIISVAVFGFSQSTSSSAFEALGTSETGGAALTIMVLSVIHSQGQAFFELQVSPMVLSKAMDFNIKLRLKAQVSRVVAFNFTLLASNAPFVASFSPTSSPTDGQTPMTVVVDNLPSAVSMGAVVVRFSDDLSSTATSGTFQQLANGLFKCTISVLIPRAASPATRVPKVVLLYDAGDIRLDFAGTFEYLAPLDPFFLSLYPRLGPITSNTQVVITLGSFPGIRFATTDAKILVNGVDAEVVAVSRLDPSLDSMAIQQVTISFLIPCCHEDVVVGKASIVVWHADFANRAVLVPTSDTFTYYNPTAPYVSSLLANFGRYMVAMSKPTNVQALVVNAPADLAGLSVFLSGSFLVVKLATVVNARTRITFIVPPSAIEGEQQGLITFANTQSAIFYVKYYRDTTANIIEVAPNSGPHLGGTRVVVTIANFPSVDAEDVLVNFGNSLDGKLAANVEVVSVAEEVTVLSFDSPSTDSGKSVLVTIEPLGTPSKMTTFSFIYFTATTTLRSVSRYTVSSILFERLTVVIKFFPLVSSSEEILVIVGNGVRELVLKGSQVQLSYSKVDETQIIVAIPPLPPGFYQVQVYSKRHGTGTGERFEIESLDGSLPHILDPLPHSACTSGSERKVFISGVPAAAQANNFQVVAWNSPSSILALERRVDGISLLSFRLPTSPAAGSRTIEIIFNSTTLTRLSIILQDCSASQLVVSVTPASLPSTGGIDVLVLVRNFDYDSGVPLMVSFGLKYENATAWPVMSEGASSNTFAIAFRMPALDVSGLVTGALKQNSNELLTFQIQVDKPCDYNMFCLSNLMITNVLRLRRAPPATSICNTYYCIFEHEVPFPVLIAVTPTEGITSGGTVVHAQLLNFVAYSLQDVTIMVQSGQSLGVVTRLDVKDASTSFTGSRSFDNQVQLRFTMPQVTSRTITHQVTMQAVFGSITRQVSFEFLYITPITGPAVVNFVSLTRVYLSDSAGARVYMEIGNVPAISRLSDTDKILIKIGDNSAQACDLIQSSTSKSTNVFFVLPMGLPVGEVVVKTFYRDFGLARAGFVSITVTADPRPRISSVFPVMVESADPNTIFLIGVEYFPFGLQAGEIASRITSPQMIDKSTVTVDLAYADSICRTLSCSSAILTIETRGPNPDGDFNTGIGMLHIQLPTHALTAHLNAGAKQLNTFFNYVGVNTPWVKLVRPSQGSFHSANTVKVYVRNFAVVQQSFDVGLSVDGVLAQIVQIAYPSENLLEITAVFPAGVESGVVKCELYTIYASNQVALFQYLYMSPPATVTPMDGNNVNPDPVLFSVHWNEIQSPDSIVVLFGNVKGRVLRLVVTTASRTDVLVLPPAGMSPGIVQGSLAGQGNMYSTFAFEFFDPPTISNVEPRTADLNGNVPACSACLRNDDGRTISIWLPDFPQVTGVAQLEVSFGHITCDGVACQVRSVDELFDAQSRLLYVTVTVPVADEPGAVSLSVTYIGHQSNLPGYDPTAKYQRATKSATTTSLFAYMRPTRRVVLAQYCKVCHSESTCLVAAACGDGTLPPAATDNYLGVVHLQGGGTLTITLDNYGRALSSSEIIVTLGSSATDIVRVSSSTPGRTVVEVRPLPMEATGVAESFISIGEDEMGFKALVVDEAIYVRCAFGCQGPSEGSGTNMELVITNFPVDATTVEQIAETVTVYFGPIMANNVIVSVDANGRFSISFAPPPAYTCETCLFEDGEAVVPVIVSVGGKILSIDTYTYHETPDVESVRFSTTGNTIQVLFDISTNRAGFLDKFNCLELLTSVQGFGGEGLSCTWKGAKQLTIFLGRDAAVLPGDIIRLREGKLRNRAGFSATLIPLEQEIRMPRIPRNPGPAMLSGPQEVDMCSSMKLHFEVASPRALIYSWTSTDAALNAFLRTHWSASLTLPSSVPRFVLEANVEYEISVRATDFLGQRSETLTHVVTKKNYAAPQIVVSAFPTYMSHQDVILRGSAKFSSCAVREEAIVFSWELVAAASDSIGHSPTVPADALSSTGNSLLIPASTLPSGSIFWIRLTASMASDVTKSSSQVIMFRVVCPPVVTIVDGGDGILISHESQLKLDSSHSLGFGPTDLISYAWACHTEQKSTPEIIVGECRHKVSNQLLVLPATPIVHIPIGTLASSDFMSYHFKLMISLPGRAPASNSMPVVVSNRTFPTVTLSFVGRYDATGNAKVNDNDRIRLQGLSDASTTSFLWSADKLQGVSSSATPLGLNSAPLVILTDALLPQTLVPGAFFTVNLKGFDNHGAQGRSMVSILVNSPPSSGMCEACLQAQSGCPKYGRSLVDTFVMRCWQWVDEDQPISYRFGLQDAAGLTWFEPEQSSSKSFKLPQGQVSLKVQVLDSLGARSETQSSTVTVGTTDRRRRRLLQISQDSNSQMFEQAIRGVERELLLGNTANVLQQSLAVASEMAARNYMAPYDRELLISYIDKCSLSAIRTSAFAENALASAAAILQYECQITGQSATIAGKLIDDMATLASGSVVTVDFAQHVAGIISTTTGALIEGSCVPGMITKHGPINNSSVPKTWMKQTRSAAFRTMKSVVHDNAAGEPGVLVDHEHIKLFSQRLAAGAMHQTFSMGLASFSISAGALNVHVTTPIDILLSKNHIISTILPSVISDVFAALMLSPSGGMTQVERVSRPVNVTLPVDVAKAVRISQWYWGQKTVCGKYTPDSGTMSLHSGCNTILVTATHVTCECLDLGEMALMIDPSIPVCGDGVASANEYCDDGNVQAGDGCSSACRIEPGWFCNYLPGQESNCCGPCARGRSRAVPAGCGEDDGPSQGCKPCTAGTFKNFTGSWDSTCLPCPAGFFSDVGQDLCGPVLPCPAGQQRTGISPAPGVPPPCAACIAGKYKQAAGLWSTTCLPLEPCSPGTYLKDYSTVNAGACKPCNAGTYKEFIGSWHSECTPCPDKSTSGAGSSSGADCICTKGYFQARGACEDVNECTQNSHNCLRGAPGLDGISHAVASCFNTPGSFECSCGATFGYWNGQGDGTRLCEAICGDGSQKPEESCDDGNTVAGDGCFAAKNVSSSTSGCAIEQGSICWQALNSFRGVSQSACCRTCPANSVLVGCTANQNMDPVAGTCQPCKLGFYKVGNGTWDSNCTEFRPCPPGSYTDIQLPGSCLACPYGKFKPVQGTWETMCTSCPAHATTRAMGSTSEAQCVCEDGWARDPSEIMMMMSVLTCLDLDECTGTIAGSGQRPPFVVSDNCPSNSYCNNTEGSYQCSCIAGYDNRAESSGAINCVSITCGDGYLSLSGEGCDDGNKASGDGCSAACTVENGFYCPSEGGKACCGPCPMGSYRPQALCPQGLSVTDNRINCVGCPAGKYKDELGVWDADVGSCKACPAGTYSAGAAQGTVACSACAVGKFSFSSSASACQLCPAGKHSNVDNKLGCTDCEVGKVSDDGAGSCGNMQPCGPGYQRPRDPSTGQVLAGPRPGASPACVACQPGKYKPSTGVWDSECVECPASQYAETAAATSCTSFSTCNPGQERIGTSSSSRGTCVACADGKYNGASSWDYMCKDLLPCELGKFRQNFSPESAGACALCPLGTYKDFEGAYDSSCSGCPLHSWTAGIGRQTLSACECVAGWLANEADPRVPHCVDKDECKTRSDNCHTYAVCSNTEGSFTCACSKFGYVGNGLTCTPICGDGWTMIEEGCDDKNTRTLDGCSESCNIESGAVCWQLGDLRNSSSACCRTCPAGEFLTNCSKDVTVNPQPGVCTPCAYGTFKTGRATWETTCSAFQPCPLGEYRSLNSATSSGICSKCAKGSYKDVAGDWTTACLACPTHSTTSASGSTSLDACECFDGWVNDFVNATTLVCLDLDECKDTDQTDNCHKYAECKNTEGSFTCVCAVKGYQADPAEADGVKCDPICGDGRVMPEEDCDLQVKPDGCTAECKCDKGWAKSPADISGSDSFCQDVNECTEGNECSKNAICTNTQGSYTCKCKSKFEDRSEPPGAGTVCASIECGDGFRTSDEGCDDGNKAKGDGCNAACVVEENFECAGGSDSSPDICKCLQDWYSPASGPLCSRFCQAASTCSGNGDCLPVAGRCACKDNYFGTDCSVLLTPLESTSTPMGTEGGSIALSGVKLVIPPGAISVTVTIGAALFDTVNLPISMKGSVAGAAEPSAARRAAERQGITLHSNVVDFKPDGLEFAIAASLAMQASSTGTNLRIGTFNPDSSVWVPVASSSKATEGALTAFISHFSLYAVINVPIVSTMTNASKPSLTFAPSVSVTPSPPSILLPPYVTGPKSNDLVILMAVLITVFSLALCGAALLVRRMRMAPSKQPKLEFDEYFTEPIPGLEETDDDDNPTPGWTLCEGCEKPVRSTWHRCPSCRLVVPEHVRASQKLYDDSAFDIPELLPSLDDDALEDLLPREQEPKAECMPVFFRAAPGAKALAKRKASLEQRKPPTDDGDSVFADEDLYDHPLVSQFTAECRSCQSPLKPSWERCPLCKAPALGTAAAAAAEDTQVGQGAERSLYNTLQPDDVAFEIQADTTRPASYLSPDGVSDALFAGESLFGKRVAGDFGGFDVQDLPPDSGASEFQIVSNAGAVEAADLSLDLDAFAADAVASQPVSSVLLAGIQQEEASSFPSLEAAVSAVWDGINATLLPTFSQPHTTPSEPHQAAAAKQKAALDANALSTLNDWIDGLSMQSGVSYDGGDGRSETGTMTTFATGMGAVEIPQEFVDGHSQGQSRTGAQSSSASVRGAMESGSVASAPMQADARGLDLEAFSATGLESTALRLDALASTDSAAPKYGFAGRAALEGLAEEDDPLAPVIAAEQLELYLNGLAQGPGSVATGEPSIYDGRSVMTGDGGSVVPDYAQSYFTSEDPSAPKQVPRPVVGSVAVSSTVDANDVGLELDAWNTLPSEQPDLRLQEEGFIGYSSVGHDLTWEQERALAFPESSVDFYALSQVAQGGDASVPVNALPTSGLQSIDERSAIADGYLDSRSIALLNLDALDSVSVAKAPSMENISERERARDAEIDLGRFTDGLADGGSVAASSLASQFDAQSDGMTSMSSVASDRRMLPENYAQSSVASVVTSVVSVQDSRALPDDQQSATSFFGGDAGPVFEASQMGLDLDGGALASVAQPIAPVLGLQSLESTFGPGLESVESRFGPLPDLGLMSLSEAVELEPPEGVAVDALASTSSMVPSPSQREAPGSDRPGLVSVAEEADVEFSSQPQPEVQAAEDDQQQERSPSVSNLRSMFDKPN